MQNNQIQLANCDSLQLHENQKHADQNVCLIIFNQSINPSLKCLLAIKYLLKILTLRYKQSLLYLQTAGETARSAGQGTIEVNDFVLGVVHDLHVKGSQRATALPGAAVGVFGGKINLLPHGVLHFVFVSRLEASES